MSAFQFWNFGIISFRPCRDGGCSSRRSILYKSLAMPEFEETQHRPDKDADYAPSMDANETPAARTSEEQVKKLRSRRRSQGFKKPALAEKSTASQPTKAEHVNESSTPPSADATLHEPDAAVENAPLEQKPDIAAAALASAIEKPGTKRNFPEDNAHPEPSDEMLARIAAIEARLIERKAERNNRQSRSDSPKSASSPRERKPERTNSASGSNRQRAPKNRSTKPKSPARDSRRSKEPGLLKKISGFIGNLFTREQPLPPEPELPPQRLSSGRASAERGSSGRGGRHGPGSTGSNRRGGGQGSSRGASSGRQRGRSANRAHSNQPGS
jgi:hypothetical protein